MATVLFDKTILIDNSVIFTLNNEWQQEDIADLAQQIFERLINYIVIETNEGADCLNIRFQYQNIIFILQFDVSSQSCWLECEAISDSKALMNMLTKMKQGIENK